MGIAPAQRPGGGIEVSHTRASIVSRDARLLGGRLGGDDGFEYAKGDSARLARQQREVVRMLECLTVLRWPVALAAL